MYLTQNFGIVPALLLTLLILSTAGAILTIKILWKANSDKDAVILNLLNERNAHDIESLKTLGKLDNTLTATINHNTTSTQRLLDASNSSCSQILQAVNHVGELVVATKSN